MSDFEVMRGLPPYGPEALPFSATGKGSQRDGLVVRFTADDGSTWTGNFQPGIGNCEVILRHPNGRNYVVITGGQGYIINPNDPSKWDRFGGGIERAFEIH